MARGHITQRGPSWYAVVPQPPDPDTGKRRQAWLRGPSKREAEIALARELAKLYNGEWIEPSTLTLADYLAQWLVTVAAEREPATYDNYESAIRLHIAPRIGRDLLLKLSPMRVQTFYAELRRAGVGASRCNQIHRILHSALEQAVRWQMIPRNVCDAVQRPSRARPNVAFWPRAEVDRWLALTADDPLGPAWTVAVLTGVRRGELCGLRWAGVDLDRRLLRVEWQIKPDSAGKLTFGRLKTSHARRAVPLERRAAAALVAQRQRQEARRDRLGRAWQEHDLVFDFHDGRPWLPSSLSAAFGRQVRRHNDVTPIRLHDLRHTAASLMLASSLSLFEVSRFLGHSSISITADLYGHLAHDSVALAVERLDAALDRSILPSR